MSSADEDIKDHGSVAPKPKGDFWYAVFECMEGKPKIAIDFEKLAQRCNYKNATTARVIYNTKRKALISADAANTPTSLAALAADKPKQKRGRKPKVEETGGEPTTKRKRGRPPAKKELVVTTPQSSMKNEPDMSEEDAEGEPDTETAY